MRVHHLRVAAIVQAPASTVHDAAAKLPAGVTAYVVETGAGVLLTLERRRRWPVPSRRRVIRSLEQDLRTAIAGLPAKRADDVGSGS